MTGLEALEDIILYLNASEPKGLYCENIETIQQALLKAEKEQGLNNGGRLPNKEVLYLIQCLKQRNDMPLLYVSKTYGNKYIVPQKQFDDLTKALEIIKEKRVDVFRFKKLDFNTFNQLQKSCKLPELTEEEFNLLKEVLE